jgi:hypothetical protein
VVDLFRKSKKEERKRLMQNLHVKLPVEVIQKLEQKKEEEEMLKEIQLKNEDKLIRKKRIRKIEKPNRVLVK